MDVNSAYLKLTQHGTVEVGVVQEAVRIKRLAEAMGLSVGLIGHPGKWRVYDLKRAKGVG